MKIKNNLNESESKIFNDLSTPQELLPRRITFEAAVKPDDQSSLKEKYPPINRVNNVKNNNQKTKNGFQIESSSISEINTEPNIDEMEEKIIDLMNWNTVSRIGVGLQNLGNTCYMNSGLQALAYTAPLANYAKGKEHSRGCRVLGFCSFCALERHINLVLTSKKSIAPKTIYSNVRKLSREFRIGRQEDAHQFITCIIDSLYEAEKEKKKLFKGDKNSKIFEKNIITELFEGTLKSTVACNKCDYKSDTFDPFFQLSLEIGGGFMNPTGYSNNKNKKSKKGSGSVSDLLSKFCSLERLSEDNLYTCEKCKHKVRATKQISIEKSPPVLCVQLKRFSFFLRSYGGKIHKHIEFKEKLSLDSVSSNKKENTLGVYCLYAVVVHSGHDIRSGHYYSFVKASSGIWYRADDSRISQVTLNTVLNQQAYLLFYKRETLPRKPKQNEKVGNQKNEKIEKNENQQKTEVLNKNPENEKNENQNKIKKNGFTKEDTNTQKNGVILEEDIKSVTQTIKSIGFDNWICSPLKKTKKKKEEKGKKSKKRKRKEKEEKIESKKKNKKRKLNSNTENIGSEQKETNEKNDTVNENSSKNQEHTEKISVENLRKEIGLAHFKKNESTGQKERENPNSFLYGKKLDSWEEEENRNDLIFEENLKIQNLNSKKRSWYDMEYDSGKQKKNKKKEDQFSEGSNKLQETYSSWQQTKPDFSAKKKYTNDNNSPNKRGKPNFRGNNRGTGRGRGRGEGRGRGGNTDRGRGRGGGRGRGRGGGRGEGRGGNRGRGSNFQRN